MPVINRLKLVGYLSYRIANWLYGKLFTEPVGVPFIREKGKVNPKAQRIVFDFSHSTTHLGDRLFFLPLISCLKSEGYEVSFSCGDMVSAIFFDGILQESLESVGIRQQERGELIVIPLPSLLRKITRYSSFVTIDFTDAKCMKKITAQLVSSFNWFADVSLDHVSTLPVRKPSFSCVLPHREDAAYVVFSNYIDSGGFRKFLVDEDALSSKAREFKSLGYEIVHVGSSGDVQCDQRSYDFVDIDLRGKTAIADLPAIINDPRVYGVVCFDNVFMHLAGIFGKKAYVLFRGRLTASARRHHFVHVNNTFFADETLLEYL